jgi:hypothetical protein
MGGGEASPAGVVLRTAGRYDRSERRGLAVSEVRHLLGRLYRGFVAWGSLYGDVDLSREEERCREEVVGLLGEFSGHYLARSLWLEQGTRKRIDKFIEKSEDLYSDFVADIVVRGYARTRDIMANRVSRELGPLKREAEAGLRNELAGARQPRWRMRSR